MCRIKGQRVEDIPTGDEAPSEPLKPDELVGRANIVRKIETLDDETQEKIKTHFLCAVPTTRWSREGTTMTCSSNSTSNPSNRTIKTSFA
jgi:hypothetical protein